MRLTAQADYAVVMMSAAARAGCGARLSATALAEMTGVPLPTAQKLMQALARAGLLTSVRGSGGGFKLTRPAAAISVADIVEAIEGPIALTTCVDHNREHCALDHHCMVKPHWGAVNDAVRGALAGVTLASLGARA
jgi:FeS assembly SUF system regulator